MQDEQHIITLNDRGQITIPKKDRDAVGARIFYCSVEGDSIILKPLKTREAFLRELDEAEEDYKKHGGYSNEEMRKRCGL